MTMCEKNETLRDYLFDELPAGERREMELHLNGCAACSVELEQLRVTTSMLKTLPDQEIPQRIGFVSDKIFAPSLFARFVAALPKYAALAVSAAALLVAFNHPAPQVKMVVQTSAGVDVSKQLNEAVSAAVRQAKAEDAVVLKTALDEADLKHQREHRMLAVTLEQSMEVLQKRIGVMTQLASLETPQNGAGQ